MKIKTFFFVLCFIAALNLCAQNSNTKYRVIVGSFLVKQNANNWTDQFRKKGYDARVVNAPDVPYNRVCLVVLPTKQQAREAVNNLISKKVVPDDSWIFIDSIVVNTPSPVSFDEVEIDESLNNQLFTAAKNGNTQQLELLITRGAQVNHQNAEGITPLMVATFKNRYEVCQILLINGADVNAKDKEGNTALGAAVFLNNYELSKLFIISGADKTIENNRGLSPLKIAQAAKYGDIVNLLSMN